MLGYQTYEPTEEWEVDHYNEGQILQDEGCITLEDGLRGHTGSDKSQPLPNILI